MRKGLLGTSLMAAAVIVMMTAAVFSTSVKADEYGSFVNGEHVISDMIKKNGEKTHPRLIMTEEKFAKLRTHIDDNSTTSKLLARLKAEADGKVNAYKNDPIPYKVTDNVRLLENSKRVQRRVADLALAYNIFGDEKYAQSAYKELENAAKFQDWNPHHFLDTGEMCTAFALGYDWLYNWMDDEQRAFLRQTMIDKGLNQVMKDYEGKVKYGKRGDRGDGNTRSYVWYESNVGDNWQYVCIGGTNLAALAIGDESDSKEISSKVLTYGCKKAYTAVRQGYSNVDGTFIEGLGYWDYATYYLGLISSSLKSTAGTDYGITNHDGIRKSVDFVRCMSSNTPLSFSFGDDGADRDTGWAVFLWLGEHFKSRNIADVRLNKIASGKAEFNYLDVLWIDESLNTGRDESSPNDWGGKGYSNASFRNTWDVSGIVTALHAGVNDYLYHGHFDLGSFYVESNGTRFITDLGNEDYELKNRINAYRIRSEGHNTLVINPSEEVEQIDGAECCITAFQSGKEAYAVTDLTAAYKDSGAKKVVRGLKLNKDKNCVIVQDDISLNSAGEIYWFAHTKGQITVASDGRSAVITVGSDKLWLGILSDGGKFTAMKAESLPSTPEVKGQADNSDYRKLAIHLTNVKNTTISVACIPLKNGETNPSWIPSGPTDFGSSMSHPTGTPTVTPTKAPTVTPTKMPTANPTTVPASPTSNPSVTTAAKTTVTEAPKATDSMILKIGDKEVPVVWEDNASVKELKALAEKGLSIKLSKYGDFEQFGSIGQTIKSDDKQITTSPGDIMLYSSDKIVLFYGSNTWAYTKLGKIGLSEQELKDLLSNGDVTITLTQKETTAEATPAEVPGLTHSIGETVSQNGVSYEISGTSSVALTSFAGSKSDVVIPGSVSVNGVSYKVTEIKDNAFMNNKKIKSLVIGPDVIRIGNKAFYGCKNLKKVTGGPKLETIGSKAFGKCPKLSTFNISSPVLKKIGKSCFYKDKKLKTLRFKNTTKFSKKSIKSSLKGSSVKTVVVKTNKVKTYKKIFVKKVVGRKVSLKKKG